MIKKILTSAIAVTSIIVISSSANAGNSAGCGLGTTIFHGNRGLVPNVLAVTTNGTSGNQTFGISSGTLGCDKNDVVSSKYGNLFAFINDNINEVAANSAKGNGEYLGSVAAILEVKESDKSHFFKVVQNNFSNIFSGENINTADIVASLNRVIKSDKLLETYAI